MGGILSTLFGTLLGRAGAIIIILGLTLLFVMLATRKLIFSAIRELYAEHKEDREEYIEYEEPEIRYPEDHARTMQTHTFANRKRRKKADKGKMKEISEPQKTPEKPAKEMPKKEKPVKEEIPEISIIREGQQEPTVYKEELETKFGKDKKEKQEAKTAAAEKKEPPKQEKKDVGFCYGRACTKAGGTKYQITAGFLSRFRISISITGSAFKTEKGKWRTKMTADLLQTAEETSGYIVVLASK